MKHLNINAQYIYTIVFYSIGHLAKLDTSPPVISVPRKFYTGGSVPLPFYVPFLIGKGNPFIYLSGRKWYLSHTYSGNILQFFFGSV